MIELYKPNQYDFVKVKGDIKFGFVWELNGDIATVISIRLSETADSILYGFNKYNINNLIYVDSSEIDICGPLYTIRKELISGVCERYIYNYEEI